ncbi:MAG: hypothetical protein KAK04_06760, partial [Cyclobacteriaceae bacterium]|nr:hypothetical protein [Cyclobacteriaceae bacterium]
GKSLGYDRKNEIMGYSIRTGKYRFTRWQLYEKPDSIVASELYDLSKGLIAIRNLANDQDFKSVVQDLNEVMDLELRRHKEEQNRIYPLYTN